MIETRRLISEVAPFQAKRHVETPGSNAVPDASFWAAQMDGVSVRRDRASFMRIYDHFSPRLQRYLRTLGVEEAIADELVQEALLTLWRKADLYDPGRASLGTWLYRVARNLYIDHVRREPTWIPVQEGLDRLDRNETHQRDSQPEAFVDHDALRQAISQLTSVQAKLVRMCYFETKSHSEISRELGMPLGSVKSSLRRAFTKLQRSMRTSR